MAKRMIGVIVHAANSFNAVLEAEKFLKKAEEKDIYSGIVDDKVSALEQLDMSLSDDRGKAVFMASTTVGKTIIQALMDETRSDFISRLNKIKKFIDESDYIGAIYDDASLCSDLEADFWDYSDIGNHVYINSYKHGEMFGVYHPDFLELALKPPEGTIEGTRPYVVLLLV